ncbi:sulfatase-like hydrolase/transferase, partial [Lutimonas sp.]|uniref:sulfatase-like hydrolase/transferase n=1 Tax=Lutimonas sp. TaxID=1872403 RepID=UPI003D9BA102
YATGIFGKWHNGAHYPYHPMGRGFDEFVGFTSGHWSSYFDTTVEKNGKPFYAEGYLPDVLTDEALSFMKQKSSINQPFFCFVPYQTPHTPLQVPDAYFDKFKGKGADDFNATMYGMAENIDDNIGRLLAGLEKLKIRDNTLIIYMSDNGPLNLRYNKGLKGRKGQVNEGGVRVPFFMNWKDQIEPGIRNDFPLAHIDVLPTLIHLLGIEYRPKNALDGINFKALLTDAGSLPARELFMEWGGNKRVLSDNHLMINEELYNLAEDEGQKDDIRSDFPKIYEDLNSSYQNWYNEFLQETVVKEIPVGYADYPSTVLPAHEANLFPEFEFRKDRRHTGIAYHSLYGWAHDWIDDWTKTNAYASWNLRIVEAGTYEIRINYALSKKNVGATLLLELGDQKIRVADLAAFEHTPRKSHDRIPREVEAPETDWKTIKVATLEIPAGAIELKVSSTEIPGEKSIELKDVILTRIIN